MNSKYGYNLLRFIDIPFGLFGWDKLKKILYKAVYMKVKASVKADPSKGDKLVRRRGRLYVINKKDPNRKQRQKGPAKQK